MTGAVFTPGQQVSIVFHLPDTTLKKKIDVEVTGRVVNLNADVDANRIGVEFLEPLGASQRPSSSSDCRTSNVLLVIAGCPQVFLRSDQSAEMV